MNYKLKLINLEPKTVVFSVTVELENDDPLFPTTDESKTKESVINTIASIMADIDQKQQFNFKIETILDINIVNLEEKKLVCYTKLKINENKEIVNFLITIISSLYKDQVAPDYIIKTLETEEGVNSIFDLIQVIHNLYTIISKTNENVVDTNQQNSNEVLVEH